MNVEEYKSEIVSRRQKIQSGDADQDFIRETQSMCANARKLIEKSGKVEKQSLSFED